MREVVLAIFDNHQPSRLMNRIEAEAFGDDYYGAKLVCVAQVDHTQIILDSRYLLIEQVIVKRVEVQPERPAPSGSVIAFCEPYKIEQRRL